MVCRWGLFLHFFFSVISKLYPAFPARMTQTRNNVGVVASATGAKTCAWLVDEMAVKDTCSDSWKSRNSWWKTNVTIQLPLSRVKGDGFTFFSLSRLVEVWAELGCVNWIHAERVWRESCRERYPKVSRKLSNRAETISESYSKVSGNC